MFVGVEMLVYPCSMSAMELQEVINSRKKKRKTVHTELDKKPFKFVFFSQLCFLLHRTDEDEGTTDMVTDEMNQRLQIEPGVLSILKCSLFYSLGGCSKEDADSPENEFNQSCEGMASCSVSGRVKPEVNADKGQCHRYQDPRHPRTRLLGSTFSLPSGGALFRNLLHFILISDGQVMNKVKKQNNPQVASYLRQLADNIVLQQFPSITGMSNIFKSFCRILARLLVQHFLPSWMLSKKQTHKQQWVGGRGQECSDKKTAHLFKKLGNIINLIMDDDPHASTSILVLRHLSRRYDFHLLRHLPGG